MSAVIEHLPTGAIRCTFPYSKPLIDAIKSAVPAGYRQYDPDDHSWTIERPYVGSVVRLMFAFHPGAEECDAGFTQASDDPWKILHLRPTAPPELVIAAHRCLAKLNHPDAGGNTTTMQSINAAVDAIREAS